MLLAISFALAGIEPSRLGAVHVAVEMHKCEQAVQFASALVAEFPNDPAAAGAVEDAKRCQPIGNTPIAPGILPPPGSAMAPGGASASVATNTDAPMEMAALPPPELTFTGLPAGALVRVTGADGVSHEGQTGWGGTSIDPSIHMPVNESMRVGGVVAGPAHWEVQQPVLGTISGNVTIAPGGPTTVDAPWSTMPGVLRLQRQRADWEKRTATSLTHDVHAKRVPTFGVVGGSLAAVAIAGVVVGFIEQSAADAVNKDYNAAVSRGDATAAKAAADARAEHTTSSTVSFVVGGVLGTASALTFGITIHEADRAKATKTAPPPWDPEHMAPR